MEVDGSFLGRLLQVVKKGAPALSCEVVLVGSNRLGQDLGRRLREAAGGWANVRFLTLLDLAGDLARGAPAALCRPIPGRAGKLALAREALRRAREEDPDFAFGSHSERAGLPEALSHLFDDLLDGEFEGGLEGGLEELPPPGGAPLPARRLAALSSVYRHWRRLLAGRALHPAQVISLGAARAGDFPARLGTTRLWVAGFYEMTPNQLRLLAALSRARVKIVASLPFPVSGNQTLGPGRFAAGFARALGELQAEIIPADAGDSPGDLAGLRRLCFAPDFAPAERAPARKSPGGGPDGSLALVSAPDEEREVCEAARAALRHFETGGIPFHRMAVTYPAGNRATYEPLVDEVFSSAGIPLDRRRLSKLSRHFVGRGMRSLLGLLGSAAPGRTGFLDLLAFAEEKLPVSPGRLERLSRRAGIGVWAGDWATRLLRAAAARARSEEESAGRRAPDPGIEAAVPILGDLLDHLASFPARGRWGDLLDRLEHLLTGWIPALAASGELRRIAGDLRALGDLEPETSREAFQAAWISELDAAPAGDADPQPGVVAADLMELRGVQFEAIFILGVSEGSLPAPPRGDPLLSDSERSALNRLPGARGRLALKGERIAEEELLFAGAVASASKKLQLSFSRSDGATGRSRLPSVFFLKAAEGLCGRRVLVKELDSVPGLRRVALTHGLHEPEESLNAPELHLAVATRAAARQWPRAAARRALGRVLPAVERLARREEEKWQTALTGADGLVPSELLALLPGARISGAGGSISASRLEDYAICPHLYLHAHALGLEDLREPESAFAMEPIDRGILAHRILESAYRSLKSSGLLPLSTARLPEALAVLDRACEEEFRRAGQEMAVGLPLLWELLRDELRLTLQSLLRREAREESGWVPFDFEVGFGRRPGLPTVVLEVPPGQGGGAISISLSGKIDRIDLRPGGAFRILDYKGGRPKDPGARGTAFQLPLYLLAGAAVLEARGHSARIEEGEAAYLFLRGDQQPRYGPRWAEALARLELGARTIAAGIESGLFFQNPGPDRENCRFCDFRNVCDPRVETIASRKSDGRAAPFREMREALGKAGGK